MALDGRAYALLQDCVESFEHLEVLLFVRRSAGADVQLAELAVVLNLTPAEVEEVALHLVQCGLLEAAEGEMKAVRYAPQDEGVGAAVDALGEAYEESRLDVVRVLSSNALERVRGDALRTFAAAFHLGKKSSRRPK